jgi:hypothetical protein
MDAAITLPSDITLKRDTLPLLAERYAAFMETQRTRDLCACEWIVHPDDMEHVPTNATSTDYCRQCGQGANMPIHHSSRLDVADGATHTFLGIRMRKGEESPHCPVHTKAGFVLHFIAWSCHQ